MLVLYLGAWILSLFGVDFLWSSNPVAIAISVVVCIVAALNLFLDFDFIQKGVAGGAPSSMEWLAAFGLLTTLVWLYLVILRLLALLQVDCSLTNNELARRAHVSPATSLRRVRRLVQAGVIERRIAIVDAGAGGGVTAIVEVTLEQQTAELLDRFEAHVAAATEVQQCYRVASGPDFAC